LEFYSPFHLFVFALMPGLTLGIVESIMRRWKIIVRNEIPTTLEREQDDRAGAFFARPRHLEIASTGEHCSGTAILEPL
jgi:hypothetical protein